MNDALTLELDLAKLSLAGKRFVEADQKYLSILKTSPNSSIAWCGLGVSKYGLLLKSNSTIEEVFYCFEKAKAVDPTAIDDVETFVIDNSFEVIKTLYQYYIIGLAADAEAKRQMTLNLFAGVISSVVGGTMGKNSSLFANLAAIGGTAVSFSNYSDAKNLQSTVEDFQVKIKSTIQAIIEHVLGFTQNQTEKLDLFNEQVLGLQKNITQYLPAEKKISESEQLRLRRDNLHRKAKDWKMMGIAFYLLSGTSFCMVFSGDAEATIAGIISGVPWFFAARYLVRKANDFKTQADDLDMKLEYE
ncbi:hypothetical protein CLV51_1011725 [Chitinophaga niastensis]|uniref:Tetratricopeptide repeat protein n=1 Tax=Chitinophaga niastensis TaxID=536980 RepID=A0A2P8HVY5_CHINA|nr:hypothetical protein [Chitinophaga niastensis]PSL50380.1 hypothetical protein CLV51_1011725 [Chitinophaga niastensis]